MSLYGHCNKLQYNIIITIEKHYFQQHLQINVIKLIDNQTSITIDFVHMLNRLKI